MPFKFLSVSICLTSIYVTYLFHFLLTDTYFHSQVQVIMPMSAFWGSNMHKERTFIASCRRVVSFCECITSLFDRLKHTHTYVIYIVCIYTQCHQLLKNEMKAPSKLYPLNLCSSNGTQILCPQYPAIYRV